MIHPSSVLRWLPVTGAVLLLAGLSTSLSAHAQFSPDRPGFGDGSSTVSANVFQPELGYAFNGNSINSHELGQLLLRYGVTDAVELRGGVGSYVVNESPFDNGYPGTSLGAKVRLFRSEVAALSGVAALGLPTGTGIFDTPDDRARQELKLAFDGALGEGLTLSVNAGTRFFYAAGVQDDRAVEWLFIPTLSVGITEAVGAYVGYAGFFPDGPSRSWVEGGLTVLRSANTQFDFNTGLRVDDASDAFFLGLGLAHRL